MTSVVVVKEWALAFNATRNTRTIQTVILLHIKGCAFWLTLESSFDLLTI